MEDDFECAHDCPPDECMFDSDEQPDTSIECGQCKYWFHPRCTGDFQAEEIMFDEFYCKKCRNDHNKKNIYKRQQNRCFRDLFSKVTPKEARPDHLQGEQFQLRGPNENGEHWLYDVELKCDVIESGSERFVEEKMNEYTINQKQWPRAEVEYVVNDVAAINLKHLEEKGFTKPIYFPPNKPPNGLVVPNKFSYVNGDPKEALLTTVEVVEQLKETIGAGYEFRYTDTQYQKEYVTSMDEIYPYYKNQENSKRYSGDEDKKVNRRYNIISLEYSKTELNGRTSVHNIYEGIKCPKLMSDINWVELWPVKGADGRSTVDTKLEAPSFMNYCLIGTKDSYTDWHIDLGGTSVWYHIHRGKKLFILVEPTEDNLALYTDWEMRTNSENHRQGFVDYCEWRGKDCKPQILTLVQGSTVFVPSGWMHCVFTPEDSIAFGGNCLHSFNVKQQMRVHKLEKATNVEEKYWLNGFVELNWYAAKYLCKKLKEANRMRIQTFPAIYIEALEALSKFLKEKKKDIKKIPHSIGAAEGASKLLRKIDDDIKTRREWNENGKWNPSPQNGRDGQFPHIENSELGTVVTENDEDLPAFIKRNSRHEQPPAPKKVEKVVEPDVADDDYEPNDIDQHEEEHHSDEEEASDDDTAKSYSESDDSASDLEFTPSSEQRKRKRTVKPRQPCRNTKRADKLSKRKREL